MILVNINPAYQPAELLYCLNKVGVAALVAAESFKSQNYYNLLSSVVPEVETSKAGELVSKAVPSLRHVILMTEAEVPGVHRFAEVATNAGSEHQQLVEQLTHKIQMDHACNIQFTSGTTGNPKGVTLSHHNLVNNAYQIGQRIGYNTKVSRETLREMPVHQRFVRSPTVFASLFLSTIASVTWPAPWPPCCTAPPAWSPVPALTDRLAWQP